MKTNRKKAHSKNKTRKNAHININGSKIDVLYWINLDRSVERKKAMIKLLKDETFDNMKKKRVKAVDGSVSNIEEILNSKIENVDLTNRSAKEYCCLLSHLNAILEFSKSNYNIALICEDDLSLDYKKYWTTDLETCIQNAPRNWEILQLGVNIGGNRLLQKELQLKLYSPRYFTSTIAYVINKKGAKRFISELYKNNKFVLDNRAIHVADDFLYKKLKTYTYKYPFFTYVNKDSTIHNEHVKKKHEPSKKIVEKMVKKNFTESMKNKN